MNSFALNETNNNFSNNTETGIVSDDILRSLSILYLLILTLISLFIAHILERSKFHYIHESFTSILLGAVFSLTANFMKAETVERMVSFDPDTFFFFLLPPIIFNAGYKMNKRSFFRSFGSILLFVFVGTTVSTFVIGFLSYLVVLTGIESINLTLIDCLIFGSLISSTDPVAVLSIFQSLKVDSTLYSIVLGESCMNDAVSIVLYEVLMSFRTKEITTASVFKGIGSFFGIFTFSFMIGIIVGCISALIFKHIRLRDNPMLESACFVVLSYISYMLAQAVYMSGIVSMLFCAMAMSHYTYDNLSPKAQNTTKYLFHLVSFLAENFIFVYLGVSIFTPEPHLYYPVFITFVMVILVIARAAHVFPLSHLINKFTSEPSQKIEMKHQAMILWSGLRGAMAFMLALKIDWEARPILVTTTLMVVLFTVVIFGSPTATLLKLLKIRVGVTDDYEDYEDSLSDPETTTRTRTLTLLLSEPERTNLFLSIDKKYIRPFLTKRNISSQIDREMSELLTDNSSEIDVSRT